MSFNNELLSLFGLARAKDLHAVHARLNKLSDELQRSKLVVTHLSRQLQDAETARSASERNCQHLREREQLVLARQKWCCPRLVEFSADTPPSFHEKTSALLRSFLGRESGFFDLTNRDLFPTPMQWALYWCVAHASCAALQAVAAARDENGASRAFLDALHAQSKKVTASREAGALQIAYNAIFDQCKPGLKEAAVGADILLIVAGPSLIPNGLARIFWIQAKRSSSPFRLSYDHENKNGLQIDALSKVDVPAKGSFGLYMQYSKALPYVPATRVSSLVRREGSCAESLSDVGVRLPELLVALTGAYAGAGAFKNTEHLRNYLDEVSGMKPLYVVTATDEGNAYHRELAAGRLLSEISDYYREKLGLGRMRKLTRDHELQRDWF